MATTFARAARISAAVAIWATLLSAPAATGAPVADASEPSTPTTDETLDRYAEWILARADGERRNGLVRKLPYLSGPTLFDDGRCTIEDPCLQPDVEQSTAACASLEFLSEYFPARAAAHGREVTADELAIVAEFADAVLDYQYDPTPTHTDVFDGAVASSLDGNLQYYTTFGNAACGQALLAAHELTGAAAYLGAATEIGEFLLRMQDPREYYAAYGGYPFVDDEGEPTEPNGGFFDQVSSWNNVFSTMSLWNFIAVSFLQDLQDATGAEDGRYAASAAAAREFFEGGLAAGTDWYTVRFHSEAPSRNRIVAMQANRADCQDNRWHRKGSCTYEDGLPSGGTLGTDMIEYGLAGLYRYEEAVHGPAAARDAVAAHYARYTSLPAVHTASSWDPLDCVDDSRAGAVDSYYPPDHQGDVPTGDPWDFDPHLSLGGFIRSAGTELVSQEAKYYDVVGFGILAEVRDAVVPAKFAHAFGRLAAAGEDGLGAIQDRTITPMALAARDSDDLDGDGDLTEAVCNVTVGTLPIAHNGLGILATLGYVVTPLEIPDADLPAGDLATGYDGALAATGGVEPYSWSLADGHLPAGIDLGLDGTLTGVPAVPGTSTFAVQVRDALGAIARRSITVTVGGCERMVTGIHRGGITADTGVVCLDGARQSGDVVITGDARLAVLGSAINGAVRVGGNAGVTLCGTDVRGELDVVATEGRVLVDPAPCPSSTVTGGRGATAGG